MFVKNMVDNFSTKFFSQGLGLRENNGKQQRKIKPDSRRLNNSPSHWPVTASPATKAA